MLDVPVVIDRDEARGEALRELSDPVYQAAEESWLAGVLRWIGDRIDDLFDGIGTVTPGGITGLLVVIALIVVIAVVVRLRVGKFAKAARHAPVVFTGGPRTSAEHRTAAAEALAHGDVAGAIRERFRAIVRGLEERGVLDERSGRTVDEAATEAGRGLPEFAAELRAAATMFDEVWYGGHPATMDGYHRLAALDDQVGARGLVRTR